jgi:glutathione peroxidase
MNSVHDFEAKSITGQDTALAQYAGQVLLVVNVASECGLTPQYAGLERLHRRYAGQGLVVLGFPCNQFGGQEPGSEEQIQEFCRTRYDITFPLFAKVEVNGANRHPLYAFLAGEGAAFPGEISWNFEKFLIDRQGRPVARFSPRTKPEDKELIQVLEKALA